MGLNIGDELNLGLWKCIRNGDAYFNPNTNRLVSDEHICQADYLTARSLKGASSYGVAVSPNGIQTVTKKRESFVGADGMRFGYNSDAPIDLENDPTERVNLWDNPNYAADKAELIGRILSEMEVLEKRVERSSYA